MRHLLATLFLLTAFPVVNAAQVSFYLSNTVGYDSAFSVEDDGVTLSFFNPDLDGYFASDSDGIAILDVNRPTSIFPSISQFNLSFDLHVRLVEYDIGFLSSANEGDESFSISGVNGTTIESAPFTTGYRYFDSPFVANAGEVLTFSSSAGAGGENLIQLYSIFVETVPAPPRSLSEPVSLGLLVIGLAGVGFAGRRKRSRR